MIEGSGDDSSPPTGSPAAYICPQCGERVEQHGDTCGPFLTCLSCGSEFAVAVDSLDTESTAEEEANADELLSALRVRELSHARRATIRSRSWLIIGLVACIAMAGELIQKSIEAASMQHHISANVVLQWILAGLLLCTARFFYRRAAIISGELKKNTLAEPTQPPDFSTLGDGSQRWKNLEKM